jgi:hypothetical protein
MLGALRISIGGDITYDDVVLADYTEIESVGLPNIFEEQTVVFKYQGRWYTTHSYALKLIQIDRYQRSPRTGVPFDKIIIDDDKIYGPGVLLTREAMSQYVPIFWENGFEKQLAFSCRDGFFVTTDYSVDTICYPKIAPYQGNTGVRSARSG